MNKNTQIIKKVAKEMGIQVEDAISERKFFYVIINGKRIPVFISFSLSYGPLTDSVQTKYKDITDYILKREGVVLPKTVNLYYSQNKETLILKKLRELKFPIIIKDAEGAKSKNIFPNIHNIEAAKKVVAKLFGNKKNIVAQEMVYGKEYRLLVLGKKVIAVLEMIPPRVKGDGKSTIAELIEKKQLKTQKKTKINSTLKSILKEQGHKLTDIPLKNEFVFIKKNACLDEGGEMRDATDELNKDFHKWASDIAITSGKILAGIDVMCFDISKSPNSGDCYLIEVNGKPDLYIHYIPNHGKLRNVIRDIFLYLEKTFK